MTAYVWAGRGWVWRPRLARRPLGALPREQCIESLAEGLAVVVAHIGVLDRIGMGEETSLQRGALFGRRPRPCRNLVRPQAFDERLRLVEIGRASCREGVCQYG